MTSRRSRLSPRSQTVGAAIAIVAGLILCALVPLGSFMQKGLTLKTGQTHVQRYLPGLLAAIMEDKIDTTFLISHRMALEDAPRGYQLFHDEQNTTTKIVLKPGLDRAA